VSITFQVMAVTFQSTCYQYAVRSLLDGFQYG
jgi:hypothetical protein